MARIYRPRALVQLEVPVAGTPAERGQQERSAETFTFMVRPIKVNWERNDHMTADTMTVTLDYNEAPCDPRYLASGVIRMWMGQEDDFGGFGPTKDNFRFSGVFKEVSREAGEDLGRTITLKCQDYTAFFLQAKHFPESGIPNYSQTLPDAWARICDHTGYYDLDTEKIRASVAQLRDKLTGKGKLQLDSLPTIGKCVSKRYAAIGKVQVQTTAPNAWQVWQDIIHQMGLLSYIDRDVCVVTDALNFYTSENRPGLIWGENILHMEEHRDTDQAGKRLAVTCHDPITHTTLEAFWPPRDSQDRHVKKKPVAKHPKVAAPGLVEVTEYEYFPVYGITSQAALTDCARNNWEQRSRQELRGKLSTVEMVCDLDSGEPFDVLSLRSGDDLVVAFQPDLRNVLVDKLSDDERIKFLIERGGYQRAVATLLVRNLDGFASQTCVFSVSKMEVTLEADDDGGGDFKVDIDYCSRIKAIGGTDSLFSDEY